ncbi:hypothetical protein CEXT_594671 [Caerostris extrusa]|uniref:Uncharacterized protein n=1 Tax=Caerostris extrusa TaxID=172846 RepID=A0AAV4NW87_CAEEX|nr:hypothetical protein CEXT_594671 [Caerostris extrusa]
MSTYLSLGSACPKDAAVFSFIVACRTEALLDLLSPPLPNVHDAQQMDRCSTYFDEDIVEIILFISPMLGGPRNK